MTSAVTPTPATYPKRPTHFAHRFTRLLMKCCAANLVGPDGVLLLVFVAHTEDARHYRGPVSFHNGQLMPLVGLGSEDTLARVRQRLVTAGWLHYEPGRRNQAPRYWVTIPDDHAGWDDLPTDDRPEDYTGDDPRRRGQFAGQVGDKPAMTRTGAEESAVNVRSVCGQSAEPSTLSLTLDKDSCPEPAKPPASGTPSVLTFPAVGKGPKEWHLTEAKLAEYRDSFPGVDVLAECRKARQWCLDNPKKRRTYSGMPRFLGSWLGRCQDSGRSSCSTPPASPTQAQTPADPLARYRDTPPAPRRPLAARPEVNHVAG